MTGIAIRDAVDADAGAIARISEEAFGKYYVFDYPENARRMCDRAREGTICLVVAELDRVEVAGFANLRSWPAGGWIDLIAVAEAHRAKGIGRLLLDAIVEKARTKGYWKLSLIVSSEEKATLWFYRENGFETVGRMKDEIIPGTDGLLMSKVVDIALHPNR
jgi:ribosomal protein S18 acetylase RimI-like enzyme